MIEQYYLKRIVKTDSTDFYRYVWDDLERIYPYDWTGFFRGCEGTIDSERYSHLGDDAEFPYSPWAVEEPVVDLWERNGMVVEDIEEEWLNAQQENSEEGK